MPYYALDEENRVVCAREADAFRKYRCLECRLSMQKRAGRGRRPHFYHLQTTPQCRLHRKGTDHLTLQTRLVEKIPALEMERPFPSILRIADLCWEEKKLIFEIQCSPIALDEVQQRKIDYGKEGYDLVWLLDDRLYNRRAFRIAEHALRRQNCYFFSMKNTVIYDQFDVIFQEKRLTKGPPLHVDLSQPALLPASLPTPLTEQLKARLSRYFFPGDLFYRSLLYPIYLERLIEYEDALLAGLRETNSIRHQAKKAFFIGLEALLRRVCED